MSYKYQVTVPDVNTWRDMILCQAACPVGTDARGYVTAMARGELELGFEISHDPNPLSTTCGRICGAPCEVACRRSDIVGPDAEPVAIRPIKRVLTERYGPEAKTQVPARVASEHIIPIDSLTEYENGLITYSSLPGNEGENTDLPGLGTPSAYSSMRWSRKEFMRLAEQPGRKDGKVALVGAGPASLTVAHNLRLLGYEVTIYEAGSKTGGTLRYGVPLYRIDQETMDIEIQEILDMGVEIKFNTPIGQDLKLSDLRRDYDAVFLGIGMMKGRWLNIEGSDNEGVVSAVDMLLDYNLGEHVEIGNNILVIGGGDVAMDAARTSLRLNQENGRQQPVLVDADAQVDEETELLKSAAVIAGTNLRLGEADIKMIAMEDWDELPASPFEIEEALEEGIDMSIRVGPSRIIGENGKVTGLEVIDVESVFDDEGRFNPKFIPGTERIMECDTVILAIGQQGDFDILNGVDDVKVTARGLIEITNEETCQTTAQDVFAGGDVAFGPKLIIDAVKHGHLATFGIEEYIQKTKIEFEVKTEWTTLSHHVMFDNWTKLEHRKAPTLPVDRRTGITIVELGYSEEEAAAEGSRCLECAVNTIFDGAECILCNACVDVCPWDCLKIVSLDKIEGDETLHKVIEEHTGVPLDEITADHEINSQVAVMLKDDLACTRCALCAVRCPTDAITMEAFRFEESLSI